MYLCRVRDKFGVIVELLVMGRGGADGFGRSSYEAIDGEQSLFCIWVVFVEFFDLPLRVRRVSLDRWSVSGPCGEVLNCSAVFWGFICTLGGIYAGGKDGIGGVNHHITPSLRVIVSMT